MTAQIAKLVERLAEMFPKQSYQTRLEAYITSKNPQNAADVDYWSRQYHSEAQYWGRGL